jgi:hypothetical protein
MKFAGLAIGILFVAASLIAGCAAQDSCLDCRCSPVLNDRYETKMIQFDDLRDMRYCEILVNCSGIGTGIFNTLGLNNETDPRDTCPAELFANYSDEAVEKQYNSPMVYMNGPRHWTLDSFKIATGTTVRNLDGLDTRWMANIEVPPGVTLSTNETANAYIQTKVERNNTWFFEGGKPVFILDDPDGMPWVMQSYSNTVDPNLKLADLQTLDTRLKLPPGWKYRTEVLPQDLMIRPTKGTARITLDELQNTYSACWVSNKDVCSYYP